jgi:hypothetical protein
LARFRAAPVRAGRFAAFFVDFLAFFLAPLVVDFFLAEERVVARRGSVAMSGAAGDPGREVEGVTGAAGVGAGAGGDSAGNGSIQPEPDQPISI